MKKPNVAAIRVAVPLSKLPTRPRDPILRCNICGEEPSTMGPGSTESTMLLYREHDEYDKSLDGESARVYVDGSHKACEKALRDHPRLYTLEMGRPGHFPKLCGDCTFRKADACSHPDLKANGGPGLSVTLDGLGVSVVCLRGPGYGGRPPVDAVKCAGRSTG